MSEQKPPTKVPDGHTPFYTTRQKAPSEKGFVGYETMIRSALPVGAVGVVAMAHQLSGRLVRKYFDACAANDRKTADRLEPALFAIYRCFKVGSYYAGIKATMNALGQPVGKPREPLLPFSEVQTRKLASILEEASVADIIRSLA